ncbi:MAG TPA: HAD-IIA family hydrolase [Acidimicrobiales bacterium]
MPPRAPAACWLCDLDGVLIHEGGAVPGADRFLDALTSSGRSYLVLTNNSMFTPAQLEARLAAVGLRVDRSLLWTSALAAAHFVDAQRPEGTAFVIGEPSLHEALRDVGYHETDKHPDYVVLGETQQYAFDEITTAIRLVDDGAHFIATNPEPTGPSLEGALPGCGAIAALIERATETTPYFIGKPNPLMIREGLDTLDGHSASTAIIGDRMETDILAGVEAGLETILVLSGVTRADDVDRYPFRPSRIVDSVADLVDEL